MKKPGIPDSYPPTREHMGAIKQNLEVITGRRGQRSPLATLKSLSISAPPTQAEVETLRAALVNLIDRLEG